MDLQLMGKKAVVTGGSRGIGRAVARRLALEGCDVAICARNAGPLEQAATELAQESGRKILPIVCNTLDPESIEAFFSSAAEGLGGINILINSAARVGGVRGDIETAVVAEVLEDYQEKAIGYLRCAQAAVPYMKQAGWGRIISIAGGSARSPGSQLSGSMRNAAVTIMTKAMANALGGFGINVNSVQPGGTLTETGLEGYERRAQTAGSSVEAMMQEAAERTLIKHLIDADDIANVIAFLCSPLAVSITGESITTNGGASTEVHL